jgi:hypothetical protein
MTNPNYISDARVTPLGPAPQIEKGRRFIVIDMGRHILTRATGVDYNKFTPGFRGRVLSCIVINEVVTTDTNADATITPGISGTATTGGVVTIADTADGTNPFTTVGQIFQGTRITAGNTFGPGDYLDIEWTVTNAFADGEARVLFLCEAYQS